jgi:DNA-binding response OmpR family regulator
VSVRKIVAVIDDEPGLSETFQDYFEHEGYDVRIARDGRAGLELLRDLLPEKPCIVICDAVMPILDGDALYKIVKADRELSAIPFVFITTDPARAPAGELIMKKPVDFGRLIELVRKCC